jgi:hypothetical protein
MKGSLSFKTDKGWIVEYAEKDFTGMPCVGSRLSLYPGDEDYVITTPNYQNMIDGASCEVDFEIFEIKDRCHCHCHNSGGMIVRHIMACCHDGYIIRSRHAKLTRP